jgi:hypothetical protein
MVPTPTSARPLLEKGTTVTRSNHMALAAILAAGLLAAPSAMAQPIDPGTGAKSPATANVYVPPTPQDLRSPDPSDPPAGVLPGPPQWPVHPQTLTPASSPSAGDGGSSWPEIGLALGGVVLLAGGGIALIRRARRKPRAIA